MALVKLVFPYQLVWLLTLLKHVYSIIKNKAILNIFNENLSNL